MNNYYLKNFNTNIGCVPPFMPPFDFPCGGENNHNCCSIHLHGKLSLIKLLFDENSNQEEILFNEYTEEYPDENTEEYPDENTEGIFIKKYILIIKIDTTTTTEIDKLKKFLCCYRKICQCNNKINIQAYSKESTFIDLNIENIFVSKIKDSYIKNPLYKKMSIKLGIVFYTTKKHYRIRKNFDYLNICFTDCLLH